MKNRLAIAQENNTGILKRNTIFNHPTSIFNSPQINKTNITIKDARKIIPDLLFIFCINKSNKIVH